MTKGILQKKESIWAQGSRGSESTIVGEAWHQEQGAEGSHLNYIQEAERERTGSRVGHTFSSNTASLRASIASLNSATCWDQVFKYMSLWRHFLFKPPQSLYKDDTGYCVACCNASILVVEEGLGIQGSPQLHNKLEVNLSYMRS